MNDLKHPARVPSNGLVAGYLPDYRALVENSPDLIWSVDAHGRWLFLNAAARTIYGYEPVEMLGRLVTEFQTPEQAKKDAELFATKKVGIAQFTYETIHRRKDGTSVSLRFNVTAQRDVQGRVVATTGTALDITEYNRIGSDLRLSEARFRRIMESDMIGLIFWNEQGDVMDANDAFLRIVGFTRDDLRAGRVGWREMTPVSFQELDEKALKEIATTGACAPFEKEYFHKDGSRVPVLIGAASLPDQPGYGIAFVIDIAQRKQAEKAARHLANFPELNPNPVLEFAADGTLGYHNLAAVNMAQKVGRTNLVDLLPPTTSSIVAECLATGKPFLRHETRHDANTLSWSFYPIVAQQIVHCYVGDITKRLQLEEQFRQAQKMEAIGQLSGGVAHDFNNLLTVILGNLGLVMTSGKIDVENAAFLEEVSQAATRAANLTRQLLTFSRQQVVQAQDLDLNVVLENISQMVRRFLVENVEIRFTYSTCVLPIHADPGMLEQVVLNLCINARDAMPRGGRLSLETNAVEFKETMGVQAGEVRTGWFAQLTVSDTGSGIAPENLQRIFEPFFTTKEVGKGTGLGLASVYGIVEQHHGWVTVESEVGRGSAFRIYLPLSPTGVPVVSPSPSGLEMLGGNETILLVEDDPSVQMVANASLSRLGYRVLLASTGHEAIRVWDENKDAIQLVLTDMVMPEGMTGKDLARHFKIERPEIKLIYMSGYSSDIAGTNFPQAGTGFFLGKPFEIRTLAEAVRHCLDAPGGG